MLVLRFCGFPLPVIDIPIGSIDNADYHNALQDRLKPKIDKDGNSFPVVVVCRKGNDSQIAINKLKDKFRDLNVNFKDLKGGLYAWNKQVDRNFPIY